MKFNPFCMCCAVSKQEQKIRSFQDMDKKVEYMKKVMGQYGIYRRGRLCSQCLY